MNIQHEKYYLYLNKLKQRGDTNMWGANKYLESKFGLDKYQARDITQEWMALPMSYHNAKANKVSR